MSSSSSSKAKKFTLKNVLDGFRGTGGSQIRQDADIEETLRQEHYVVTKTVRHGFPFQPTALAYDPVQHLLAIGNKSGGLRIIGQPGVDCFCSHDTEVAITQIIFLVNEGTLVTVRSDDHLHLWDFRQKQPKIVHSLKFQKEKISKCHLPFQSSWLYVGTERGNVHVANVETFTCSGYIINWNKAIELSRKSHPGPVVHLSDNPNDPSKLLIGFESGAIVLWDLKTKSAEFRYSSQEALRSISWHNEGKQFMCSHSDGSLSTWNVRTPQRPLSVILPHAKSGAEDTLEVCKPIAKVEWRSAHTGEPVIIFSGGLSYDKGGRTPCLTVMAGKNTTVLEMEHTIIDFISLCDTPWDNDIQDPYAIVVLLENDLVVIDLNTSGYPCFENPYPMDLHESPVTACQYYANCPMDIIPALYSTGKNQKKAGFSEQPWPIKGGSWGARGTSYPEIIITGHADGSLKFWDASAVTLQFLYKLKTAKVFEKPKKSSQDEDPFAIQMIFLCMESRMLCVAGPTHCALFRFSKQEISVETVSLEFAIVYEVHDDLESPDCDFSKPCAKMLGQNSSSLGSHSSTASDNTKPDTVTSVKVRSGSHRWGPGFLPELVCILCCPEGESPGSITVMSLNSSYGLLAFGNESGLAIVDYLQKACLLNLGTPDLYGSMDPYQRASKSLHTKKSPGEGLAQGSEDSMSPSVDQSAFYQILSHGSNKSDDSSPSSPLTPNSGPGGQAIVPNVGGGMTAQALKLYQPAPTADLFSPGHNLPDPDSLTNLSTEPQFLTDNYQRLDDVSAESSDMMPHVSSVLMTSMEAAASQFPGLDKLSRPLNLFEKDKSKVKYKHKTVNQQIVTGSTKGSTQSKYNQQRSLVHQQALDLPPGGSSECSNAYTLDANSMTQQQDAVSPPTTPFTPIIMLPRSASEINEFGGRGDTFFGSNFSGNLDLLHPTSYLKPKSISTGDITETQDSCGESSCLLLSSEKKETERKMLSVTTNLKAINKSERKFGDLMRKSSSDSQISLSDKPIALKVTHRQVENQSKNWLMNQMRRISKKKRPIGHEMGIDREIKLLDAKIREKQERISLTSSNCNTAESKEMFSKLNEREDDEDFTVKGHIGVKSPEDNANFFRRVSLKIKSFGSRKHSNEDEDKEMGAAAVDKTNQQLQDRQHKVTIDVLDLSDDTARKHSFRKMYLSEVMQSRKSFDKVDVTFSRSRSSSISSLDNVSKEAIQSLVFADSYTSKQDNETSPCLWVGTSLGSVIVIALIFQREQRLSQPVIVSPSGSLYRMKGAIVCMSFLDFKGCLIPAMSDQWKDNRDNKDANEKTNTKTTSRQMSLSTSKSKICSSPSTEINSDKQFAIICSEKQARVIALPSQTCAYKLKVTESSFVVKAEVVGLRESVCLMCYVANGRIMAFSLPSLKPLFDADFLPLIDYRVARTFCFSNSGHAMFMCSPTEIQKITYSAEISETLNEMLGDLYIPKEMPEAPKQSFLKSLFSSAAATLDREELFGEASGKASKSLVKHIPGLSSMQQMHQQTSVSGNEFSRARMLVNERREKLSEVEDRSAQMMYTSEQLSSASEGIKLKYKDKKWYQF